MTRQQAVARILFNFFFVTAVVGGLVAGFKFGLVVGGLVALGWFFSGLMIGYALGRYLRSKGIL